MPRPRQIRAVLAWLAAATACAALGPAALHSALAAAAGTLFEAAPFVLVAEALPAGPLRALCRFAGCGCGRGIPGALSAGAVALCWFAFGPLVTLARTLVALLLLRVRPPAHRSTEPGDDAFGELLALAPAAATAMLLSAGLARFAPAFAGSPVGALAALCAGAALGCVAPCGTAAVAMAAALAAHVPYAAAGTLLTGGLVPRPSIGRLRGLPVAPPLPRRNENARVSLLARASLALALAAFVTSRAAGFVNPRLLPFLWLGTCVAAAGLRRPATHRAALLVPALMLAALACGSPQPRFEAQATQLDAAFAGERLAFTGVAHGRGATTVLQRFAIACCRADAAPVAVRMTSLLAVPDGAWVAAHGVLEAAPSGLVLRAFRWRRIAAPADPFLYR